MNVAKAGHSRAEYIWQELKLKMKSSITKFEKKIETGGYGKKNDIAKNGRKKRDI